MSERSLSISMEVVNNNDIISITEHDRLKVAHFGNFGPNQAGICQTTIDMIKAERSVGIDAQYIDFEGKNPCRVGLKYNGVTTVGPSWADGADLLVRHSAIPHKFERSDKPIVMCLHGRPEYTFVLEYVGRSAVVSEYLSCANRPNYRGFITFWKEHLPFLNFLLPDRSIDYVPAMVDLDKYNPNGTKFNFGKASGSPNIVIADMFRADTTPFNVLLAAGLFVKKYCPEGRIHIFGLQRADTNPVKAVIDSLLDAGVMGHHTGIFQDMDTVYRAADILVTPHIIATRIVRESLASGLPIVGGVGNPYTGFQANACDTEAFAAEINRCWQVIKDDPQPHKTAVRVLAEDRFSIEKAGCKLLSVFERVVKESKANPVKLKKQQPFPRVYNFVAYAPSDHDKDLGWTYNQYMDLLGDDDWACFLDHDAMFTTDDWYKMIELIIADNPDYGMFTAVTNRIGNPQQKIANLDNTNDMAYHRDIGDRLVRQGQTTVMDVTNTHCISGVVMIIKKSVWKKAGGFKSGFLGIDNEFHKAVAKAGSKIGVARGLYVYHWYRQGKNDLPTVES